MPANPDAPVIVAGVAELNGGDPALAAAAEAARDSGAVLHLVHAFELPRLFRFSPGLNLALPEGEDSYHDAVLGKLQGAAGLHPGAGGAICHVLRGPAEACLVEVARRVGATVLVVGATRASRLHSALLGTTAQAVLRQSDVPVLVVRGAVERPLGRLLLATDLSGMSVGVIGAARRLITALWGAPAETRALYVVPWTLMQPPSDTSALVQTAWQELDEFLARHAPATGPAEPVVCVGEPGEVIVAAAESWRAALVVVGTHARGWGGRLLLGSVAEATLRGAPCAVLAVPPVRAGAPPARTAPAPGEGAAVMAGV